jgi:hypothetical protein
MFHNETMLVWLHHLLTTLLLDLLPEDILLNSFADQVFLGRQNDIALV